MSCEGCEEVADAMLACDHRLVGIFVDLVFRNGKRAERAKGDRNE